MAIIIDEKINVLEKVKEVLKGGHILAVYRECDRILVENYLVDIVREYKITSKVYPSNVENTIDTVDDMMDTDDDVRMLLCFGGYNIVECAKVAATMMGIPLVVVLTSPSRVVDNEGYIFVDGALEERKTVEARYILAPTSLLATRGGFDAIIGNIGERLIVAIDKVFGDVVSGKGLFGRAEYDKIVNIAESIHENDKTAMLQKAYLLEAKRGSIISEIANILSYNSDKNIESESLKFVISYIMLLLYDSYIKYDGDDLLYPPDIVESAKKISNEYSLDISECISGYKMMSSLDYMRAQHIVGEYRRELSSIIDRAIAVMERLAKVYRRVSKDAGYNMFNDISLDSLLESISLMSIFERENTPLRIMKAGGYLEHYIKSRAV